MVQSPGMVVPGGLNVAVPVSLSLFGLGGLGRPKKARPALPHLSKQQQQLQQQLHQPLMQPPPLSARGK